MVYSEAGIFSFDEVVVVAFDGEERLRDQVGCRVELLSVCARAGWEFIGVVDDLADGIRCEEGPVDQGS